MNNDKACGQLPSVMESTIQILYRELTGLKQLWDTIKANFEKVIKLNGRYKMAKLTSCILESYPAVTESISARDTRINDPAIRDITIEDSGRSFFIMSNLPNTEEWQTFSSTLDPTEKAETVKSIVTHLLSFKARFRMACGLAPDAALNLPKKDRG
jgi:hypothetical protein